MDSGGKGKYLGEWVVEQKEKTKKLGVEASHAPFK